MAGEVTATKVGVAVPVGQYRLQQFEVTPAADGTTYFETEFREIVGAWGGGKTTNVPIACAYGAQGTDATEGSNPTALGVEGSALSCRVFVLGR